ncbi:hypothetical protein C8R43DRAFT_944002 [Mycena crocata]|nr:hypothetical protein C8R43DRAFT_944002 [Mycena crocata]
MTNHGSISLLDSHVALMSFHVARGAGALMAVLTAGSVMLDSGCTSLSPSTSDAEQQRNASLERPHELCRPVDETPDNSEFGNNGTFTLSTAKGSSASFSFSGTQCEHGRDDDTARKRISPLFSTLESGALRKGQHVVVITNTLTDPKKPYLDIDYVMFTSTRLLGLLMLRQSQKILPSKIISPSSHTSQEPSNAWKTDLPSDMSGFQSGGHLTEQKDASAILSFSGDVVSLFGAVGPKVGPYSVKVDSQSMGGSVPRPRRAGDHTLEVVNQFNCQPTSTGQGPVIDFARVAGLPASSASSTSSASTSASASSSASAGHKPVSGIQLGGYIAAGIAAVCLVFTIVGLIYRQMNRRNSRPQVVVGSSDVAAFTSGSGAISLNPITSRNTHTESETAQLLDPRSAAVLCCSWL